MFNEKLIIEVCVAGAPPFICAINGNITTCMLEEIEVELDSDELWVDGIYTFHPHYEAAEYDCESHGMTHEAYWELNQVNYEPLQGSTEEI